MGYQMIIMFVVMAGLIFYMNRTQKKQAEKRMESLNKLQKGYEVITIGGLYGTVDEVDTEKRTVVLDVDGVYLTFELTAIKTVLPQAEAEVDPEAKVAIEAAGVEESAIEE
ncbi:preprotein translocase subunit YajC [Streptococcus gordonii]|jgi:preprotein translocase, yajC subunit|uniref:Preprotein translocase, YajC subunit n=2 Tax=Streptococcus gordonii TaxID=1302 RepID=A8AZB1_STRGC|nr:MULTISPECIES: preprotein translocase subunit YajC [Streptococcus]RKW05852.1 MAG: preprotein translocase subunit YajC [Streptococcus sp.]ABV09900.1 preprotein translocase, YajC subunit [Streptococcus gordonii str. Challis substr. CH1]ALD71700.1 preprotein translocase subunit YajC [Streptococcus gordonii]AOS72208.1 preprotein translocase subunit YajC [Streptococcus gordonii]EEY79688.2 preprotein translocase, YajC subunit [Streptococcus sp. 2_1_36FAA]